LAWSDWLGSYGSCWLEVGAEGEFKLDLRQDRDPGKQKLKGAVRTETYQCHHCQQCPGLSFFKWLCKRTQWTHNLYQNDGDWRNAVWNQGMPKTSNDLQN
jgi:hypothetical protein